MKTLPSSSNRKKIAIIGIGCRFAGCINSPESFWTKLKTCADGIKDVPADRWNTDLFYDPNEDAPGKMYVKRGAFLEENVYDFDYNFFNISRREALTLDPQQRLLLMTAYEALDDAGQQVQLLKKTPVGVFIGGFMLDNFLLRTNKDALKHVNSHTAVAGSATLLSNRISHVFDLTGPSVTIDTACSSSLVAIHLACRSILNEEAELAIAGGVNVMLSPAGSILMCKGKFLARDGRSKAFFEHADGYGRGEGAGIIVLKALDKAIADNDAVYAVIESTAINQDGRTDGISLPNRESQIAVIKSALKAAEIHPALIDYVEAHGTGTKAGDPIELGALGAVYGRERARQLPVGSVKVNIGHTEAAAGVAGVIKTALMLKNSHIVPHMNLGKLSADIPFEDLNIRIPLQGEEWYLREPVQYAAVNSFGYGGTNGHAILSSYAGQATGNAASGEKKEREYRFLIAGRSANSLRMNAATLLEWLKHNPGIALNDLAYTLTARKTRHACNWFITAGDHATLINGISEQLSNTAYTSKPAAANNGKLVWVFTGMGPQWYGMGQELYRTNKVFRSALDTCDAMYSAIAGCSLLAEMQKDAIASQITKNYLAQAANFFIQIGISEMLDSWGVPKDAIVGHSVGEIAAAVIAKAITLEDGIKIIYYRGHVLEEIAGQGTLLSIGLGADEATRFIRRFPGVEIAAVNAPGAVAVAGKRDTLEALDQQLAAAGVFSKFVRVEVAYHSSQMNRLKEKLLSAFSSVTPALPATRLYSTVTGAVVDSSMLTGSYWWKNVREPVRFQATLEQLMREQYANFIEIGPHPVLGAAIKEIAGKEGVGINTFFTLKRETDEGLTITRNMEELIDAGIPLSLNPGIEGNVLRLPAYAWDKEYCWALGEEIETFRLGEQQQRAFLQERVDGAGTGWKTHLNKPSLAWLKDHQVGKAIVFPGAGYIECMLAALSTAAIDPVLVLEQVTIDNPLSFQPDEFPELYIHLSSAGTCSISSRLNESWTAHARGTAWTTSKYHPLPSTQVKTLLQETAKHNKADAYHYFASLGLHYKHYFQTISAYTVSNNKVYARLDSQLQQDNTTVVDPTLLDGAFQSLLLLATTPPGAAYLPVGIDFLKVFKPVTGQVYCTGTITGQYENTLRGNLQLVNATGDVLVDIKGLICKKTIIPDSINPMQQWIYKYAFRAFELEENQEMADVPIIVTGDRERSNQLAAALGQHARFVPATALAEPDQEDFQLVYLPSAGINIDIAAILADCHRLIRLLQDPLVKSLPLRFVLLLDHGLTDETKPDCEKINIHHTSLAGFGRVVMTEMPDIHFKIIDIQRPLHQNELQQLLQHAFQEEELILTAEGWQQGMLVKEDITFPQRTQAPVLKSNTGDSRLEVLQKGKMDSLQFRDFNPGNPGPHEVQIDIAASSINFKDVMKAMGMLNEAALENTYFGSDFGLEGAGIVRKVHATVKDIREGDRVYFLGKGLRTKINVQEDFVFKLPDNISFHEAATFLVYFTSWVALVELGQLKKGQRVLIHAAAGGVGLAACKIALARGAEIFATAGTDPKKALLKKEGIRHVYDSRSLNFYDEILKDTNEEGVDLVLNSLAGPALFKSLELVRTLGTFIELGKQDITNNNRLPLMPFNKSIRFISLDLDKILPVAPDQIRLFFQHFIKAYTAGELPPLLFEVYDLSRFRDGFKKLATGSHAGKIVIDLTDKNMATVPEIHAALQFAGNECVLITGGCSGFGLRTAIWLAERGARHLLLGSRSGVIPPAEAAGKEKLQALGCSIYEITLDVTDKDAVKNAVQYPAAHGLRLVGVIHAAAVLEDSIIRNLTPESFNRVYLPKALGALHLHEATKELPLKFFICYASGISYVGNPGQVAYAAANSLLNGLVDHRRKLGLNSIGISWGSISEVGILSRNEQAKHQLSSIGFTPVPPETGLHIMEQAIRYSQNHIAVIDADWDKWVNAMPGTWKKMSGLVTNEKKNAQSAFTSMLLAHHMNEWDAIITAEILEIFARITGNPVITFQSGAKLTDLGLDSLMSVELSIALQSKLGLDISMMEILGTGTINRLVQLLKDKILRQQPGAATVNGAIKQPPVAPVKNMVNDYLTRICVGRPYFSLTEIKKVPEGLTGIVPGFYWNRNFPLNLADTARHLALLGSCVAADVNPDNSRYCYPVQSAELKLLRIPDPQEVLTLSAKLLSFDRTRSRCECYTTINDSGGNPLLEMHACYHTIPEATLYQLFEAHINTDASWQDIASGIYEGDNAVAPEITGNGQLRFVIDQLNPEQCVGHFSNLPAFPVSVMTRYAAHLIEAGRQHFYQGQAFEIERITCETERFAFAGECVLFTVYECKEEADDYIHWVCEIEAAGKKIARLDSYEKIRLHQL